jgi:hypothetical protein
MLHFLLIVSVLLAIWILLCHGSANGATLVAYAVSPRIFAVREKSKGPHN